MPLINKKQIEIYFKYSKKGMFYFDRNVFTNFLVEVRLISGFYLGLSTKFYTIHEFL